MAYGTPTDPVGGTVITVAYAKSNILDPIRWLRLLTGNADPPGSSYVVVSDSTTGMTWKKIPTDAIADGAVTTVKIPDGAITAIKLAAGAVVAHLGYTPVNKAGDAMTGTLSTSGDLQGSRLVLTVPDGSQPMTVASTTLVPNLNANQIQGQNLAALDARYINTTGPDAMTGNFTATGDVIASRLISTVADGSQPMSISSTTLVPNLNANSIQGQNLAALDSRYINATGPDSMTGNFTASGDLTGSRLILNVSSGQAMSVPNTTVIPNLNADLHDGAHASGTPTASTIPIADGGGHIGLGWLSGITNAQIAAGYLDGPAITASLRTLGAGAQQAAAGNHAHSLMARMNTGSYAGNSGTRTVTGLGFTPSMVVIFETAGAGGGQAIGTHLNIWSTAGGANADVTFAPDEDGFHFTSSAVPVNASTHSYQWVAIG